MEYEGHGKARQTGKQDQLVVVGADVREAPMEGALERPVALQVCRRHGRLDLLERYS